MKAIALTLALVGGALAVVAAAVFGLEDRRILVSPPEAVVEDFVRALERGRFPQARKYLSQEMRSQASIERLREAKARLDSRAGEVQDVKGEEGRIAGVDAEAAAVIKTRGSGEVRLAARLRREAGEWRLRGIEGVLP